jgi:hypothetical protein
VRQSVIGEPPNLIQNVTAKSAEIGRCMSDIVPLHLACVRPGFRSLQLNGMPLTVFDIKGIPGHRRERIEAAVVAGGKHVSAPHEAWIATDPFTGGFRVLITGPHGFERIVVFAIDDDPVVIAERVREMLDE